MDLSSIPRPEGVSPTAVPVVQWDTACCNGDLARRKQLLENGWEPTNINCVVKPTNVLQVNGAAARKDELIVIWGFKRVRNILWVEATQEQAEPATA